MASSISDRQRSVSPAEVEGLFAPKTPGQVRYVEAMQSHAITFGIGPAGSGKTYLATGQAVNALLSGSVKRLVLVRPAVEAGEKLGFLPGDFQAKVNPYLRPIFDALGAALPRAQVQQYVDHDIIEIAPLAFMRGRTLHNAFVILDEAQNCTPKQMLMLLTRLGKDSRAVITGDVSQSDLGYGERSGLADALERLKGVEGIAFCHLGRQDIVRHSLVQRIVEAYDPDDLNAAQPNSGSREDQRSKSRTARRDRTNQAVNGRELAFDRPLEIQSADLSEVAAVPDYDLGDLSE